MYCLLFLEDVYIYIYIHIHMNIYSYFYGEEKLQIGCFEWVSPWEKKELRRSLKNIYCTKSKIGKFPEKASSASISQRKLCVGEVSDPPGAGVTGRYESLPWIPWTKLGSSAGAAHILRCWTIPVTPFVITFKTYYFL